MKWESGARGRVRDNVVFQTATLIHDVVGRANAPVEAFAADLLRQEARRGRLYIAEGVAGLTSQRSAKRSFQTAQSAWGRFAFDCEDVLRRARLPVWSIPSDEVAAVRRVLHGPGAEALPDAQRRALYAPWLVGDPAVELNALICLAEQVMERLALWMSESAPHAEVSQCSAQPAASRAPGSVGVEQIPVCPQCGKPMAMRIAKSGRNAGHRFWGCTGYPDCKGVVNS